MLQNQPEKEEMNGNMILNSTKVREVIQNKRRLVEVPYTVSVADTFNALLANNIARQMSTREPVAALRGYSCYGRRKSRGRSSLGKQTEAYYQKVGSIYHSYSEGYWH